MKPPKNLRDHIDNELAAADMLKTAPPAWVEFYRCVREAVEAKVRAEISEMPPDRKRAAEAWRWLQQQLQYLAIAEDDDGAEDVIDFTKGGAA